MPETDKNDPQTATKRKLRTRQKWNRRKPKTPQQLTRTVPVRNQRLLLTVKLASREIEEASHSLKYLLVNKSGRVELPEIEEQALKLGQDNGRGQDIERLVQSKVGGKIRAYFKLLKRGQIIPQLIYNVRHIFSQCK